MRTLNNSLIKAAVEKVSVTLYTRPGCHLCDEAKEAILAAGCDLEYTLAEVNIETDASLLHRYRNDIPVILINGKEAFRHRVAPGDFKRQVAHCRQAEPVG